MQRLKIKRTMARAAMLLVMLLTTATAWAAVGDVVDSGTCGDNLTWTLAENDDDPNTVTWGNGTTGHTAYTLTITGSGAMTDYTYSSMPWYSNQQSVTRLVLPDGLTHVGNYAFNTCNNVRSVTLPASVTSIGESAFTVVGVKASSCSFTAAEGSLLSSIGTDGFNGFGGNVDLRNCTSLTTIGEKVFENYKTNTVYLPVSMRTVAKDAFYSTTYSNNKPKVYVRCQNSVLAVNGEYKTSTTSTVRTQITSYLDLKAKSSAAVSISQIRFDDIDLTWDSDGKFFAIADEQDLIDLAEYVRGGSDHGCEGVTFKMTADLDFTDMPDNYHDKYDRGSGNFLPIGLDNGTLFKGHFDGDGHTITGLRFDYPYTSVGLFRAIASAYAVVEGVTLVSPNFSAYNEVGGIAGGLQQGIVRNCAVVGGTLSVSNERVGGIVGFSNYYNSSSIKSISGCTVVGTTLSGPQYVGIIVGANSGTSDANAALTISGCTYHNPDGLDVCGYGSGIGYTDGGGNQRVYQARLSDGLTAATAAYSHGHDYYFTEGTAVTLGHGDRPGYDFGGYESSDVTISEGAFEMPASDVTVGATWTLHDYTITYDLAGGTADNVTTYNIESDAITLTNPTRTGYDFAGWTGTDLDDATETVTIDHGSTGDRSYTATWTENVMVLADATDNTDIIADAAASGKTYNRVTLQGRTLYKDGAWNTICLPFDVTIANSPLSGDDVVAMTLNTQSSGLSGTTLTLYFDNAPATIPAGTPFIIKWGTPESHPNSDLNNPVFTGVTIDNTASTEVAFTGGTFKGTYSPITWSEENKSILFVGAGNTLYYPEAGGHVNACRAYFDLGSASAREFVLNFGEEGEVNGVKEVNATLGVNDDSWYTLDGVKLSGKPTQAGLYIHNGKKVIIK